LRRWNNALVARRLSVEQLDPLSKPPVTYKESCALAEEDFVEFRSTCCHTFCAISITTYLQNGGTLEHAQQIAAHDHRVRPSCATAPQTRFPWMK